MSIIYTKNICPPNSFFAAANSGHGFKSFYSSVFEGESILRRYLIKGGPGTGKSTFLRKIAAEAEKNSRAVEYYFCSSDPDSLDGIIIDGKIAFLDSTAPHSEDCVLPGARDEMINLGEFWESEQLLEERERIKILTAEKSECYKKGYRFLSAAAALSCLDHENGERLVKKRKLQDAVARIFSNIKNGEAYAMSYGLRSSIGMKGEIAFDTYTRESEHIYYIEDFLSTGSLFLAAVIKEAENKKQKIRVSYSPLEVTYPDAVMLVDEKISFVLLGEDESVDEWAIGKAKRVNMQRFVSFDNLPSRVKPKKFKSDFKNNQRMKEALLVSAKDELREAGEYHFMLEDIYKKHMNFEAESDFTQAFMKKLFDKQ